MRVLIFYRGDASNTARHYKMAYISIFLTRNKMSKACEVVQGVGYRNHKYNNTQARNEHLNVHFIN